MSIKESMSNAIFENIGRVKDVLKTDTAKIVLISGLLGFVGGVVKHTLEDIFPQKNAQSVLQENAYTKMIQIYKKKYGEILHIQKEDVHLTPWQLWDIVHGTKGWDTYVKNRRNMAMEGKFMNIYHLDVQKTNDLLEQYGKKLRVENVATYLKTSNDRRINGNDQKLKYLDKGDMPTEKPMFVVTHWTENSEKESFLDEFMLGNIRSLGEGKNSVHFIIGKSGRVVQMAPLHKPSAAAGLDVRDARGRATGKVDSFLDTFGIHIEIIGSGRSHEDDPKKNLTPAQTASLYDLYEVLQKDAGFPTSNIIGHLEGNNIEVNRVQFERSIRARSLSKKEILKECYAPLRSTGIRKHLHTNFPDTPKVLADLGLHDCTHILGNNYSGEYHSDFSHGQMNVIREDYKHERGITN